MTLGLLANNYDTDAREQISYNRTEIDWTTDDNSALEFELGLWTVETLHRLHNSLESSVESLFEARYELMEQIKDVSIRSDGLREVKIAVKFADE